MRNRLLLTLLIALSITGSAQTKSSSDEQKIRALDKSWSQAADAKDLDKTVSYYADDASVLPYNAPIATGKQQIRDTWQHLMSLPGFGLTFAPTKVEVAKSGDMAYEIGTFELKVNDANGHPTTALGKFVVAWQKSAQGQWKVKADIFNTNN